MNYHHEDVKVDDQESGAELQHQTYIASVKFSHCNWHTQTTRNRLNAVIHALHRLDYAHKIGGFNIQNGIIHIQHYGEWVSLDGSNFDYDQ